MNRIKKVFNSDCFFISTLFLFIFLLQEPSSRLFGTEIHYIGESLARFTRIFDNEYSAYIVGDNIWTYKYLTDLLSTVLYNLTDNILLSANIGRLICALLFCFSIFHFSKSLNFDLLITLSLISIFMLMNQQIIGGDKMTANGYNSAAISYALNILGISFFLRNSICRAVVTFSISTHFHFIIGGLWFVLVFLGVLFEKINFKKIVKYISIYVVLVLPVIFLLFKDINLFDKNILNVAEITALRSKHHVLPFYDIQHFIWWIPGIAMLLFYFTMVFYDDSKNNITKKFRYLILITVAQLLLCLLISPFDSNYFLSNFSPYRTSTLLLFLLIAFFLYKFKSFDMRLYTKLVIIFPLVLNVSYPALGRIIFTSPENMFRYDNSKNELYDFIIHKTKREDVIVAIRNEKLTDLEIRTYRPTYFTHKFIPANSKNIIEWYNRKQYLKEFDYNACIENIYKFNYIIVDTNKKIFVGCGKVVFKNNSYTLLNLD